MSYSLKLKELVTLEKLLSTHFDNLYLDSEAEAYFGRRFTVNSLKYHFRIGKITPSKAGHFVTFWRRTSEGPIAPFHLEDHFKCLIIWVKNQSHQGFFLLTKSTLAEHEILSTGTLEGKRGFRVYAPWEITESRQASQSQAWQCEYFVDLGLSQDKQSYLVNLLLR